MTHAILLATPHSRYDRLQATLEALLPGASIAYLRTPEELDPARLAALRPNWIFFPHWSWKIPESVWRAFRCVIFHMTDLPYGRGGSPLQNLILRGHRETQLTALRCDAALDAGPVYLKYPLSLEGTAEEILCRAADLMPDMIREIVARELEPVPQIGEPVVFHRRKAEEGDLAGIDSLERVYDHIRMLDGEGYPPAYLQLGNLRITFRKATLEDGRLTAEASLEVQP